MTFLTPTQIWIFLAGVLAAAQLGKMPALLPAIRHELGIGLVLGALIISLVELGGAMFGAVAASVAGRLSQPFILRLAIGALGLGSIVQALATGPSGLVAGRILEAAGYLGVIVTAPVLIARAARPGEAGRALAIWSTFVAIGIAIGTTSSGFLAEHWGWRSALLVWAAVLMVMLVISLRVPLPALASDRRPRWRGPNRLELITAAGFGFYACFQVGILALAPEYLTSMRGFSVHAAGGLTGLGAAVTALGALAPLVMGKILHQSRGMTGILTLSLLAPPCLGFVFLADLPVWCLCAAFVLLNALSGIYAAMAFARMPLMSRDGDVTGATGAFAQCGATGSLLGPPAYGLCVTLFSWQAAALFGLIVSVLAFSLNVHANRRLLGIDRG